MIYTESRQGTDSAKMIEGPFRNSETGKHFYLHGQAGPWGGRSVEPGCVSGPGCGGLVLWVRLCTEISSSSGGRGWCAWWCWEGGGVVGFTPESYLFVCCLRSSRAGRGRKERVIQV